MPLDPQTKATYRLFSEASAYRIPADTGLGELYRPMAVPEREGRVATPETFYDFFINDMPNPREAKAFDPDIDRKIRMHPDVRAAMAKREKTVAGYPDRIDPNPLCPDQQLAKKLAEEVEWAFRQIGNLPNLYVWLQQAVICGGVGVEFVWHREANGTERPVEWWPIHQSRFSRDRLGNLALRTRRDPVWGAYVAPNPGTDLHRLIDNDRELIPDIGRAPGNFMYHVYRQEAGTWDEPDLEGYVYWGIGEDVALYYPVVWDWLVLRMRTKWLEAYGDPPIDIYYPESLEDVIGPSLKRIADKARFGSVNQIPKTPGQKHEEGPYEIVQRDVPSMSYDAFERFSDGWAEKRINKILLGSADESQKGEHGGYSDHVSRKESGPQVFFSFDAKLISNTLNTQLIPQMFRSRFPNAPLIYCPIHVLEPKEERDREQEADIIEKASKIIDIAKDEVYEKLGFRQPNPSDEIIEAAPDPAPLSGAGGPGAPGGALPPGKVQTQPKGAIGQKPDNASVGKNGVGGAMPKQRTMPRGGM